MAQNQMACLKWGKKQNRKRLESRLPGG
jgi:hypothetical protein